MTGCLYLVADQSQCLCCRRRPALSLSRLPATAKAPNYQQQLLACAAACCAKATLMGIMDAFSTASTEPAINQHGLRPWEYRKQTTEQQHYLPRSLDNTLFPGGHNCCCCMNSHMHHMGAMLTNSFVAVCSAMCCNRSYLCMSTPKWLVCFHCCLQSTCKKMESHALQTGCAAAIAALTAPVVLKGS